MKVVQVLPDLNGGGVERGTLEVAEALVKAGHESIVVSAGGGMVAELESLGSRHTCWNLGKKSPLTFVKALSFRRWLQAEQPDILHVRSRMPAWVCWLAWRSLPPARRPRLVTTVHGLYSVSRYSRIMCQGERVIAVSNTVRDYIVKNYPDTDPDKIRVIHRGVDPQLFPYGYHPDIKWLKSWWETYPDLADSRVITLPGRLTRLKGHQDFIELIARLHQKGLQVYGLIVGGEDPKRKAYAAELKRLVGQRGLEKYVIFTGARRDIRDIFAISDLVLSLSTKPESFGRTVLESLRLGIPTAGYDHGGVGEILAAVYPQGRIARADMAVLEQRVYELLNHPEKPEPSVLFYRQSMLDNTLALYEELKQAD